MLRHGTDAASAAVAAAVNDDDKNSVLIRGV